MLRLEPIKRTDSRLLHNMQSHYSQPKGFVGRNICYAICYGDLHYGAIVGGSATLHLPGRDEYFNMIREDKNKLLKCIVNNIFYHIEKVGDKYPTRNFSVVVLNTFCNRIIVDWLEKYGDPVIGFESLVELPRTGELYKRAGWHETGITTGYTCKRGAGKGTDSWSGKRIWDTKHLRPKHVFCNKIHNFCVDKL